MGNYTTVLLATFTNDDYLDSVARRVFKVFQVENERLFIFTDLDDEYRKIVTYNVLVPTEGRVEIGLVNNTIRINRKKESNTLYTINALNKIIEQKTGKVDPSYNLDWQEYKNCLLISDKEENKVVIVNTEVYNVIEREIFFKNKTAHFELQQQPKQNNNQPRKKVVNGNKISNNKEENKPDSYYNR